MSTLRSLAAVIVLLPLATYAQNLRPKKDLAFAQVAAGGAYETVINVTNRGSDTYDGVLKLYHQTQTGPQPWSPLVNGSQITSGTLNIALIGGATATYRITLAGGTEAGFAVIKASNEDQDNFLEGTLTYYVRSGETLADSVGVQPSSEFYLTAIPFDDFSRLAMALVNTNTSGITAKLSVFNSANVQVATLDRLFLSGEHLATYLWQLFPGVQVTGGRLEIQSSPPIIGTILTDINGQLSSLPMLPAVKAYTFTASIGGIAYIGEMSFWFDGFYVQGYVRPLSVGGVPEDTPEAVPLTGSIVNGVLQTHTAGNPDPEQLITYVIFNQFSLSQATQQGSLTAWLASTHTLLGSGTLTLTAVN